MNSRFVVGGALAAAALALGVNPVASQSMQGASVDVTVEVGPVNSLDVGSIHQNTGEQRCGATILDEATAFETFRVSVPATCFDEYLVEGVGYGPIFDEPRDVPNGSIQVEVPLEAEDGSEGLTTFSLRLPPELTDREIATVMHGEGDEVWLFDAAASGCSSLIFETEPLQASTDSRNFDLACEPVCQSFTGYQLGVLASNPSMYLPLDGSGRDVSSSNIGVDIVRTNGGGSDGTSPFYRSDSALPAGESLSVETFYFNGLPHIRVPNTPTAAAAIQTGNTTIEFLYKVDGSGEGGDVVFASTRPTGQGGLDLFAEVPTVDTYDVPTPSTPLAAFNSSTGESGIINGSEVLPGWHHVALTHTFFNAGAGAVAGEAKLYLDGVEVGDVFTPGALGYDADAEVVFNALAINSDNTVAAIDELAIYSRALSAAEIQEHVNLIADTTNSLTCSSGVPPAPSADLNAVQYSPLDPDDVLGDSPFCAVGVDTLVGWCFEDDDRRSQYIEDALIGVSDLEPIWIGRFDEEVVAP